MKINPNGIPGQHRHGDVLIERVGDAPKNVELVKSPPVLAEGETSGHSHRIFGKISYYHDEALARSMPPLAYIGNYAAPEEGAEIKHINRDGSLTGEHSTLPVSKGVNIAIGQREYDPEMERRAAD